jgi:hypothetical protein
VSALHPVSCAMVTHFSRITGKRSGSICFLPFFFKRQSRLPYKTTISSLSRCSMQPMRGRVTLRFFSKAGSIPGISFYSLNHRFETANMCSLEDFEVVRTSLALLTFFLIPKARHAAMWTPSIAEEDSIAQASKESRSAEFFRYGLVLINDRVLLFCMLTNYANFAEQARYFMFPNSNKG